ncbi:MAG: hypothetical protein V4519_01545 [Patescibacteria group bacterium]
MQFSNFFSNTVHDSEIGDVLKYAFNERLAEVLIFIGGTMVWWVFVVTFFGTSMMFLYLVPLALAIAGYYLFYLDSKEVFIEHYAASENYTYSEYGEPSLLEGSAFKQGHSHTMKNVIRGHFENHEFQVFTFTYALGEGKETCYYTSTVFELDFEHPMPHMVLVSRYLENAVNVMVDGLLSLAYVSKSFPMVKSGKSYLALEGDFQKYFNLYIDKEHSQEVLEIFSPDVMADFIDYGKHYSVEFVDDKIYIFYGSEVNRRKELDAFYALARLLTSKMAFMFLKKKPDWLYVK